MRCEANVSMQEPGKWEYDGREIKPIGDYKLNPKVEVKNINSFKAVEKAIEYEIKRQALALKEGEIIMQETRGWNENKGETVSQRVKETVGRLPLFSRTGPAADRSLAGMAE